ncbi:MAG: hypothetical protein MUC63_10335 [Planctomycetes bacterium]|nr:hypothetical protein [Planctomycetota bacterium]
MEPVPGSGRLPGSPRGRGPWGHRTRRARGGARGPAAALARLLLAALAACALPSLAGCEGAGALSFGNPTLSRLGATSDEEAADLPPNFRYRWAFERWAAEASDFRRGIRTQNAEKVAGAGARAARYLAVLLPLLAEDRSRRDALEAVDRTLAIAEAMSGGRVFRSAEEAARQLEDWIEERLHPDAVKLVPPKPLLDVPEEKKGGGAPPRDAGKSPAEEEREGEESRD